MSDIQTCPMCGSLPCDQATNPFASISDYDERAIKWMVDHATNMQAEPQALIYHVIELARRGANMNGVHDDGFDPTDFAHLHEMLMRAADNDHWLEALLPNSFNTILAALKRLSPPPQVRP